MARRAGGRGTSPGGHVSHRQGERRLPRPSQHWQDPCETAVGARPSGAAHAGRASLARLTCSRHRQWWVRSLFGNVATFERLRPAGWVEQDDDAVFRTGCPRSLSASMLAAHDLTQKSHWPAPYLGWRALAADSRHGRRHRPCRTHSWPDQKPGRPEGQLRCRPGSGSCRRKSPASTAHSLAGPGRHRYGRTLRGSP